MSNNYQCACYIKGKLVGKVYEAFDRGTELLKDNDAVEVLYPNKKTIHYYLKGNYTGQSGLSAILRIGQNYQTFLQRHPSFQLVDAPSATLSSFVTGEVHTYTYGPISVHFLH